ASRSPASRFALAGTRAGARLQPGSRAPRRRARRAARSGSAASRSRDPLQQIARRVLLRIADDRRASAVPGDDRTLRHGIDRVVGAVAVKVGVPWTKPTADYRAGLQRAA